MKRGAAIFLLFLIFISPFSFAEQINPETDAVIPDSEESSTGEVPSSATTTEKAATDSASLDTTLPSEEGQESITATGYPLEPYMHQLLVSGETLSLPGSFDISLNTGSAVYSYDIKVPAGTRSLQPELKLVYTSHGKNKPGLLGSGWDLTESYIEKEIDSGFGNVTYNLILNGQEKKLIYSSGKYHTQQESFLSIKNLSSGYNNYGKYWSVKTKDGTEYKFGYSSNSEQNSSLVSNVTRWYLESVTDIYGNNIYYNYSENPYPSDIGAIYLNDIQYNNDRNRKVEFVYESSDRSDYRYYYGNDHKRQETRRLKEILVKENNQLVRKYIFNFNETISYSLTFLSSITEQGNDGFSNLSSVKFSYNPEIKNWAGYTYLPVGFPKYDGGVRAVDLNRDGLMDFIQSYYSNTGACPIPHPNTNKVYINNGSEWILNSSWNLPVCFGENHHDYGTRFVDLNQDGLVDIIHGYGNNRSAWINTGFGWQANNSFAPPKNIVDNIDSTYDDMGFRLADITNDGRTEIVYANETETGGRFIWKLNNTGWVQETQWTIPFYFVISYAKMCGNSSLTEYGDSGVRILDFSSDYLYDLWGNSDAHPNNAYINRGTYPASTRFDTVSAPSGTYKKFFGNPCAASPSGDSGYRMFDANGDGLMDLMQSRTGYENVDTHINNGHGGYTKDTSWNPPLDFVDSSGNDEGVRFDDVNGDGAVDLIEYDHVSYNKNVKNYLLNTIQTELGEKISIDYMPSTLLNNTGNDSLSDLGFNVWVVSNITKNNNVSGSHNTNFVTYYNYSGGMYDYKDGEFRGFAYVEEISGGKKIKHYFYQDDAKKNIEYKTEIFGNDSIYQKTESSYNATETGNYYVILVSNTSDYTYDGNENNPKEKFVSYDYDSYGNPVKVSYAGDAGISGDEKYEYYEYAVNETAWIVNKVKNYTLADSNNNRIRNTLNFYDNLNYGTTPIKGSFTRTESWLNGNNPIINYGYNNYGNLINQTDAKGYTTEYGYDGSNTFVNKTINTKGQISHQNYNLGTGNLNYMIDSNGEIFNYSYDVFGRVTKEILPYDNFDYPTKEYSYEYDGIAPEKVKISYRESNGTSGTYDEYSFYDGKGKLIQTKTEAEGGNQIVKNIYYDENGRVKRESNPYFASFFANYSNADSSVRSVNYSYDAVDRVVEIINPDNSVNNASYNHWNITFYDENGNRIDQSLNAYGQITEIKEYNEGDIYTTAYSYDSAGNLIEITDALGNIWNYTYDRLGRKTAMDDPDLGVWKYSYDSNGNLINQTDNRNLTVFMNYDSLNRVAGKNSSSENISYVYDAEKNNTLSQIKIDSDLTINYGYDSRLRKISEIKTIDENTFVTSWIYDSMDRVVSKTLPSGIISYAYNSQGQLSSVGGIVNLSYNEQNQPYNRTYGNSLMTSFSYNSSNFRLMKINTPSVQDLNYNYDSVGNVMEINDSVNARLNSMQYDDLDRLIYTNIDTADDDKIIHYTYNAIGNMINSTINSENITFDYGQSLAHAPIKMTHKTNATSGPLPNDTYKFVHKNMLGDVVAWLGNEGNIVLEGSCFAGASCDNPGDNSFIVRNSTDDYVAFINNSGDLCLEVGDCSASTSCNPTRTAFIVQNSSKANVSYIDFDGDLCLTGNLYERISETDTGEYPLIYDANGNLISGFGKIYTYNDFNQLVSVNNSNGLIAKYVYDDSGNRVKKVEPLTNTTTYYVDASFIQVRNSSGVYNETYYYDSRDLVAKKDNNGEISYYHPDHLGSTSLITNSSGRIVENTFYMPYGEVISGGDDRFGYTSKEKDTETNLNYYGARYYDSYSMHFTQADSVIADVYNPQSLNRYSYVLNNPYKYVDESGHFGILAIAGAIATTILLNYAIEIGKSIVQGESFFEAFKSGTEKNRLELYNAFTTEKGLVEFAGGIIYSKVATIVPIAKGLYDVSSEQESSFIDFSENQYTFSDIGIPNIISNGDISTNINTPQVEAQQPKENWFGKILNTISGWFK